MIRTAVQNRGIRYYEAGDAPEIVRLFFETVRSVNRADYSDEQLEAWAPGVPDPEEWHARIPDYRVPAGFEPTFNTSIRSLTSLPLQLT